MKLKTDNSQKGEFSFAECKAYWMKKWRRDHIALLIVLACVVAAFLVVPLVAHRPWFAGLMPLAALMAYGWQNNQMMSFVEKKLYEDNNE